MPPKPRKPAIEGWFTLDPARPRLLGTRCAKCEHGLLPEGDDLLPQPGLRRDRVRRDRALAARTPLVVHQQLLPAARALRLAGLRSCPTPSAAVELEAEKMVVLGQVEGAGVEQLEAGHADGAGARRRSTKTRTPSTSSGSGGRQAPSAGSTQRDRTWRRKSRSSVSACIPGASGDATSSSTASPRRAPRWPTRASSGSRSSSSPAPTPSATAIPAHVAGATFAQALGWTGAQVDQHLRRVRVGRAGDRRRARADPRGPVRRRARGRRRHHAEGLLRAAEGRARHRSRLAALPPARRHQPDLLRALRAPAHGGLRRHARGLRAGEGEEQPPRPLEPERALPQGGDARRGDEVAGGLRSAAPARHLRHQRRRRRARALEPRVRAQAHQRSRSRSRRSPPSRRASRRP